MIFTQKVIRHFETIILRRLGLADDDKQDPLYSTGNYVYHTVINHNEKEYGRYVHVICMYN